MDGAKRLPAVKHQGENPWSSESPVTPSSGVEALSATGTWSPSWPGRRHPPPLTLLLHPLRLLSWSLPPLRGASVAPQTVAFGV